MTAPPAKVRKIPGIPTREELEARVGQEEYAARLKVVSRRMQTCDRGSVSEVLRRLGWNEDEILTLTDRADKRLTEMIRTTLFALNREPL